MIILWVCSNLVPHDRRRMEKKRQIKIWEGPALSFHEGKYVLFFLKKNFETLPGIRSGEWEEDA